MTISAYLFGEVAALLTLVLFTFDSPIWKTLISSRGLRLFGMLALFWFIIEQVAITFNIWSFTGKGTAGVFLMRLPLEEYIFVAFHILYCAVLVLSLNAGRNASD